MDFFHPHPTPSQLFRDFESGRISREELHAQMGQHQRHVIEELEENRRNPVATMIEQVRNRRAASKLTRHHEEAEIREVLVAISEQRNFPPSNLLWNAGHLEMPLFCFVRTKHEPVFRVTRLDIHQLAASIHVEYGSAKPKLTIREAISLRRNSDGVLFVDRRKPL